MGTQVGCKLDSSSGGKFKHWRVLNLPPPCTCPWTCLMYVPSYVPRHLKNANVSLALGAYTIFKPFSDPLVRHVVILRGGFSCKYCVTQTHSQNLPMTQLRRPSPSPQEYKGQTIAIIACVENALQHMQEGTNWIEDFHENCTSNSTRYGSCVLVAVVSGIIVNHKTLIRPKNHPIEAKTFLAAKKITPSQKDNPPRRRMK